jgi:RNA polymerase sigma-70 factor (ECF subfamily)
LPNALPYDGKFATIGPAVPVTILPGETKSSPQTMTLDPRPAPASRGEWFASTHWSVVMAAKNGDDTGATAALEKLCRTYWPPLYAFIRRDGYDESEAKDLTQEFFLKLIERDYLQHLRHQRGKFRSFILTLLKHFLQEQRGKAGAQKRGGGKVIISLDQLAADGPCADEPADHFSPDHAFERRWAQTVLQTVLNRLREEYAALGKAAFFDVLKEIHPADRDAPSYAEIGDRFGMSEVAVKSAVQRMRRRHRELLREEIAHTVTRPEDVDEEIRHLRTVLAWPYG